MAACSGDGAREGESSTGQSRACMFGVLKRAGTAGNTSLKSQPGIRIGETPAYGSFERVAERRFNSYRAGAPPSLFLHVVPFHPKALRKRRYPFLSGVAKWSRCANCC